MVDRTGETWYNQVIEALQRATKERCNPSHFVTLPPLVGTIGNQQLRPVIDIMLSDYATGLEHAASSPDKMRFFLDYMLALVSDIDMPISSEDLLEIFLLSPHREVNDYSVLDMYHAGLGITNLAMRPPASEPDSRGDHKKVPTPLDVTSAIERILIRAFIARVRTRDDADHFMAYVAKNCITQSIVRDGGDVADTSMDRYYGLHPYEAAIMESAQVRQVEVIPGLVVDRHRFSYPYLMAVYDAFCGRLDTRTIEVLTTVNVPTGVAAVPATRCDKLIAIAETLLLGRAVNRADNTDSAYNALYRLLEVARVALASIGRIVRYQPRRYAEGCTMHGTIYGIIAASMYDESLFTDMLRLLGPKEADEDTRVDLLVSACAIRYANATRNERNGLEGQLEAIVHKKCMGILEEYYYNIMPTLEEWDVSRGKEDAVAGRTGTTLVAGSSYKYTTYPGYSLWMRACVSEDQMVVSALLPFAECRGSSKLEGMYSAEHLMWMDYNVALGLPHPKDYANLTAIGMRLPAHWGGDGGLTRWRYLGWLCGMLPHVWDGEAHGELKRSIEVMERTRGEEVSRL